MLSAIIGTLTTFVVIFALLQGRRFMSNREGGRVKYHVENDTSKGVNVTKRMQELGAPPLLDGDKYAFFETAYKRNYESYYRDETIKVSPAIAIMRQDGSVYTAEIEDTTDLTKGFLEAAKASHKRYREDVEEELRKERIRKFAEGKPFHNMAILGEKAEWKED